VHKCNYLLAPLAPGGSRAVEHPFVGTFLPGVSCVQGKAAMKAVLSPVSAAIVELSRVTD
jgi:hypothetical protein